MKFDSLSADHNLEDFDWYVFHGEKTTNLKGYNQRHTLTLSKGDVYGVRSSRLVGKYQAVKRDMSHVLFRNIPEASIDKLLDKSKKYRGAQIVHPSNEGRKRAAKVSIKSIEAKMPNRLVDEYFSPKNITERTSYDRQDYQWRKVSQQVKIVTKKMGKARKPVEAGDMIGMRFVTTAKGGYIIMPNQERVNIPTEVYKAIVESSRILPRTEQLHGTVDMLAIKDTILADRPEQRRANVKRRVGGDAMGNLRRRLANDPILGDDEHDDFEEETDADAELLKDMLSPGSIVRIVRARERRLMVFKMVVDAKRRQTSFYFIGMNGDVPDPNVVYFSKVDSMMRSSDVKSKIIIDGHYPTVKLKRIRGVELADAKTMSLTR